MRYLAINFNLARSFLFLIVILDESLGSWNSLSLPNEVSDYFNNEGFSLSEPVPDLHVDDLVFNNNNEYLDDAVLLGSGDFGSSTVDDLFAIADNEQQFDECFSVLSSPPSRTRTKRLEGVCPNPDGSEIDEPNLEVIEQIKKLWCSESAVVGFQNIPVCRAYGSDWSDTAPIWSSPEFPSYRPAVPLPGSVMLKECKLSKFDSKRTVAALNSNPLIHPIFKYRHGQKVNDSDLQ